ncbi:hypothetical protein SAMN05216474_0195 [Lishizhenia tianjinensis]|uniref:Uncharacterized protein n=1 Tax=Lishizhenia tianjinensis TaxID=477690 RepID=A0A1I6XGQ4_9FLAO|nr:hypothetical protein [Lishizhenia tianjinensis]SFT37578.1 hypothetical protein SAMN05216474_0195 [Lishizhenia tianjinensis]
MNTTFKETQKFTQLWIWVILLAVGGIMTYQFVWGNNQSQFRMDEFLVSVVVIFLVILLFLVWKQSTEISEKGIKIQVFPFFTKNYKWEDIAECQVIKYGFVGWGIRFAPAYGWVYNIKGNKGLRLVFINGKKRLIGTQKAEELQEFLKQIGKV